MQIGVSTGVLEVKVYFYLSLSLSLSLLILFVFRRKGPVLLWIETRAWPIFNFASLRRAILKDGVYLYVKMLRLNACVWCNIGVMNVKWESLKGEKHPCDVRITISKQMHCGAEINFSLKEIEQKLISVSRRSNREPLCASVSQSGG